MTVTAVVPWLVCLVGAVVYAIVTGRASIGELARISFGAGLLVGLLTVAHEVVRIGH